MKTYFVKIEDCPFVKIGKSKNVISRLSSIQSSIPFHIKLVSLTDQVEEIMHDLFKPYSHYREWFRYEGELKTFIKDNIESIHPLNFCDKEIKLQQYGKLLMSSPLVRAGVIREIQRHSKKGIYLFADRIYKFEKIEFKNDESQYGSFNAKVWFGDKFQSIRHRVNIKISGIGDLLNVSEICQV